MSALHDHMVNDRKEFVENEEAGINDIFRIKKLRS